MHKGMEKREEKVDLVELVKLEDLVEVSFTDRMTYKEYQLPKKAEGYDARYQKFMKITSEAKDTVENMELTLLDRHCKARKMYYEALKEFHFVKKSNFNDIKKDIHENYTIIEHNANLNLVLKCMCNLALSCYTLRQWTECKGICEELLEFYGQEFYKNFEKEINHESSFYFFLGALMLREENFEQALELCEKGKIVDGNSPFLKVLELMIPRAEEDFKKRKELLEQDHDTVKEKRLTYGDYKEICAKTTELVEEEDFVKRCEVKTLPVRFKRHLRPVGSVLYLEKFNLILTAARDNNIRIYDYEKGELVKVLRYHSDEVNDLIQLYDDVVLSCSDDGRICCWSIRDREFALLHEFSFSGKMITRLLKLEEPGLFVYLAGKDLKIMDFRSRKEVCSYKNEEGDRFRRVCGVITKPQHFLTDDQLHAVKLWKYGKGPKEEGEKKDEEEEGEGGGEESDIHIKGSEISNIEIVQEYYGNNKALRAIKTYVDETGKEIIVTGGEGKEFTFFDLESMDVLRKVKSKTSINHFLIIGNFIIAAAQTTNRQTYLQVTDFEHPDSMLARYPVHLERISTLMWTRKDRVEFATGSWDNDILVHGAKNLIMVRENARDRGKFGSEYVCEENGFPKIVLKGGKVIFFGKGMM